MDLELSGKVALVAGATKGLGYAVALELAREGAKIAICARETPRLPRAVETLREATGAEVIGIPADLADAENARGFVRKALGHYGTLDILVTNAGGPPGGLFFDFDDAAWERAFHLTFMSATAMIREAVPVMREKRFGRILNMTSVSVKEPIEGLILSNSIRAAVVGMAKSLATELAPHGITVNNICPGFIATERIRELSTTLAEKRGITPADVVASWEASIPAGRLGDPSEYGALAAFLASGRAAYITGASIQIDGGYFKGLF